MPHAAPPPRRLSMIAAMSINRVIGVNGGLPWKLPDEMQQFRAYTLGHPVIMGRASFEAEGKPLPHRRNIVLTTQQDWSPPETVADAVEVCHSLEQALELVGDSDPEPFITGGGKIYELALPRADRMVLTTVHAELDGDTFFPEFDPQAWAVTDARHHLADDRHAHAFTVHTLDRVR
ncbi:MAG: dihydrofolate reductase [Planctomycetota bacterium]